MSSPKDIDRAELRRMARLSVQEGHTPDISSLSEADVKRLFYEFGVYQSELIAANEQLEDTRCALEAARDKYTELYELAPVGYVSLDEKGVIRESNLTMCTLLGLNRSDILDANLAGFLDMDGADTLHAHLRATLEICSSSVGRADDRYIARSPACDPGKPYRGTLRSAHRRQSAFGHSIPRPGKPLQHRR